MMEIRLCLTIGVICVLSCVWQGAVLGAPSFDGPNNNVTASFDDEVIEVATPIRYNGAQLWRVDYNSDASRQIIADLQRQFGLCFHSHLIFFSQKSKSICFLLFFHNFFFLVLLVKFAFCECRREISQCSMQSRHATF